ncbi:unnamed protein product [Thelazia callipaeda]|uniref:EF-hand domain-containing protein n=1 Tax=Thelazia callipaeda TaxID=103827 RepID=A0A0N5CXA5_THECL|nr:unnamed protein product [Thelazia callipaeda]
MFRWLRYLKYSRRMCSVVIASAATTSIIVPVACKANESKAFEKNIELDQKLNKYEMKFLQFASVEYDGIVYMTPADFLDSMVLDMPKGHVYRRVLSEDSLNKALSRTPKFSIDNKSLFRELDRHGIISYSDFLFLLAILTKSDRALRIAFILFDRDDNKKIEKDEFLLKNSDDTNLVDTTLIRLFFGCQGNELRSFEEINKFRDNLRNEIAELEFNEFSHGRSEITPLDFARLILRYSSIRKSEYEKYIERMREKSSVNDQGITFSEYESFSQFLNDLKKFTAAVRLYARAGIPMSQSEFHRAVHASTGHILDKKIVNLLFRLFDTNNDNCLSYTEFIAVMNDRLHRGFQVCMSKFGKEAFKQCIRKELASF